MTRRKVSFVGLLVSLIGLAAACLCLWALDASGMINSYVRGIIVQCLFAIIMVTSLNLVMGFLGQIALGHAGFMAIGAYTSSLVTKAMSSAIKAGTMAPVDPLIQFVIGLLCGALMAALFGLLVGIPALRLRGDYLAIITLGFGEIIRVVIQNLKFAGGKGLAQGQAGQALIGIMKMNNIYILFGIAVLCVGLMYAFVRSKFGRAIMAIREDDIASSSVGVNTTFYKVLTFTISAFFAGVAGAIFAHRGTGSIQPGDFSFLKSTEYVIMVVLGGMGSLTGSVIAAISLSILPEVLRVFSNYRMLVYSVVLVIVMIFRPIGLCGKYEFSLFRVLRKAFSAVFPKRKQTVTKGGE
jgi:branched-chain amino acid transport system permease protein